MCVFRGQHIHERFHRQSYFFYNYAYDGDYDALSRDRYNRITVREGELYGCGDRRLRLYQQLPQGVPKGLRRDAPRPARDR